MGFFDNLGKAISDVGQKGKDIASVAKYNRMIADEERDITKFFEQVGKKYYEIHKEDFEESFAEIINGINEAKERIQGYKETVDMLQGIVRCANCGTDVPEGAAFCPECGQPIIIEKKEEEIAPDPDKYYCTECGKEVKAGTKFCIHCGAPVDIPAAPDIQEEVENVKEAVEDIHDAMQEAADESTQA